MINKMNTEMKEESKNSKSAKGSNDTGLSIETLKKMGYNYPCTARRIIEDMEQGKDPKCIDSGLIKSLLTIEGNGHVFHSFVLSYTKIYPEENPSCKVAKDNILLIDRKWVPANNGKLLGNIIDAICDGKTVEEALECLKEDETSKPANSEKEEETEKARECNKIDDFYFRKLGDSLFIDVTTKGGFLTIKVDVYRFQKVLSSDCCNYYDFAEPFIGKDYSAFLTAIRDAILEISENGQGIYAKKEAPAPESNDTEGEKIRVSTDISTDEIEVEVNTAAACDDTSKAKDSDKEEAAEKSMAAIEKKNIEALKAANEMGKDWWTQPINDMEFTREEFEQVKAELAEKSEAVCDLQCAVSFCKDIFEKKCGLYGLSFSEMNLETLTDQLFMKATILKRRLTDRDKSQRLGFAFFEGIRDEFAAVVNYGVIALRQGGFGVQSLVPESPIKFYTDQMQAALSLISEKGDEYGELWRELRIGTLADMIYTKVRRLKGIEDQYRFGSMTKEGYHKFAGDQYRDLINYGLFGVVRMTEIADVMAFEMEEDETDEGE